MFDTPFFASPEVLVQGALVGFVFGFLLQKGGLARFDVIVGQFRLTDFTVAKTMGTAIVVGGIGVHALAAAGAIDTFHVKAAQVLGNALGGLIFGVGMAVLGYCPGTGVAAIGQGSRHAVFGLLGMIAGAAIYAEAHASLARSVLSVGNLGKATLMSVTGLDAWVILAVLAIAATAGFVLLERSERRGTATPDKAARRAPPREHATRP